MAVRRIILPAPWSFTLTSPTASSRTTRLPLQRLSKSPSLRSSERWKKKGRGVGASAERDQSEVNVTASMTRLALNMHGDNHGDPRKAVGADLTRQGGADLVMLVEALLLRAPSRTKKTLVNSSHPRGVRTFHGRNAVGALLLRPEVRRDKGPV